MKPIIQRSLMFLLMVVMINFLGWASGGCSGGGGTVSDNQEDEDDNNNSNSNNDEDEADGTDSIPSGSMGFFTHLGSSSSFTVTIASDQGVDSVGGSSGYAYIFRYIPGISLDRLDNTMDYYTSYSCDGGSSQYPITNEDALYNFEYCSDVDSGDQWNTRIDIEKIDPSSGEVLASRQNVYVPASLSNWKFAVVNDVMYYVNLDGNLVSQNLSSATATTLLPAGSSAIAGKYYSVGGQLISVVDDTYANDRYLIKTCSTSTGVCTTVLDLDEDYVYASNSFRPGDDALYWYDYNTSTDTLTVYRYPIGGSYSVIYTADMPDSMITFQADASRGYVFIGHEWVASRTSGTATSWDTKCVIYDVSASTTTEIDIGDMWSGYTQIMVYE